MIYLFLELGKIIVRKYRQGIDFLGYVAFPNHRILRIKTKRRMLKNIKTKKDKTNFKQMMQSYFGMLKHCHSFKILRKIKNVVD